MIDIKRPWMLLLILIIVVASVFYLSPDTTEADIVPEKQNRTNVSGQENAEARIAEKRAEYESAKRLVSPNGYINAENVSLQNLVSEKVVLIDFWTYSCINCQRTLPPLRNWYRKYRDYGLEIVGVHTPEFAFEKKRENIVKATERFNVTWPVVMDNDYQIWNLYGVRAWPTKFLIDPDGFIVYRKIGEGGYKKTERKIRELLKENARINGEKINLPPLKGEEKMPEFNRIETPEIYFGSFRNDGLILNVESGIGTQELQVPENTYRDRAYLGGTWNIRKEYAEVESKGKIHLKYGAKNVNFVASAGEPVNASVYLDGEPIPSKLAGNSVKSYGDKKIVTIQENMLYEIVRDNAYRRHTLELEIKEPGLEAYTFTFG